MTVTLGRALNLVGSRGIKCPTLGCKCPSNCAQRGPGPVQTKQFNAQLKMANWSSLHYCGSSSASELLWIRCPEYIVIMAGSILHRI